MKANAILIKTTIALLALFISAVSSASTIYLAEIDPNQSSGVIEGESPYQISGSLKVIVDGNSIQFENIDVVTTPLDVSNELLIPAIGSYDGLNFEYSENPSSLPVLGNWYAGTFDGNALFMQATTYNGTLYDFTINTLSISAVPIPSAVWLFGSGLLSLIGVARRKKA